MFSQESESVEFSFSLSEVKEVENHVLKPVCCRFICECSYRGDFLESETCCLAWNVRNAVRRVNGDESCVWGKPVPVAQSQIHTGSGASRHHCALRKLC